MYKREVRCQRCPRIEHQDVSLEDIVAEAKAAEAGEKVKPKPQSLNISMDGTVLAEFAELCSTCRDIVTNHIEHIARVSKHKSSKREKSDA
jgi:hypothetical protein